MRELIPGLSLALLLVLSAMPARSETSGVYHPYVNRGETEVEYGIVWRGLGNDAVSLQRVSIAQAWTDRFATELYLLSEGSGHGSQRRRSYELEALWQLTEQGEYWADVGLLLEFESGRDDAADELSIGLLLEKELGQRLVATANVILEYESGDEAEFESALHGQLRYLLGPALEPAFELYLDDEDYAAGPALLGSHRLAAGRQLRWELGLPLGIGHQTPAHSLRFKLEFEF